MVPRTRLAAIDASAPFAEALEIVVASPYSRLPVYRGSLENIIGILHTKDVVTDFINGRPQSLTALLKPIVGVSETMPADKLLTFLRERRSHQALVLDAGGTIVGFITVEDVLAELLGGVSDEFKTAQMRALTLSDGRVRLPGAMRLEQAAQIVDTLPGLPGETVSSLITSEAGRLPEPGEHVIISGLDVEVETVENRMVMSAIFAPPNREPAGRA
jgi:CBS domain containing-hemolysin-like protein